MIELVVNKYLNFLPTPFNRHFIVFILEANA